MPMAAANCASPGVSRTTWSNPGPNAHTVTTDAAMKVTALDLSPRLDQRRPAGWIMAIGNMSGRVNGE